MEILNNRRQRAEDHSCWIKQSWEIIECHFTKKEWKSNEMEYKLHLYFRAQSLDWYMYQAPSFLVRPMGHWVPEFKNFFLVNCGLVWQRNGPMTIPTQLRLPLQSISVLRMQSKNLVLGGNRNYSIKNAFYFSEPLVTQLRLCSRELTA